MILFILLYKVVLTFESVEKSYGVTIQMKASEKYFPVVLFIMLCKVVLTFESVNEIQWCDHSNESFWEVSSCGTVYYAVQGGSNLWVWMKSYGVTNQMKATKQYFPVILFIML